MRITRLVIENFRRIGMVDIQLQPAAFLIGPNNTGKSSVIAALEALLSLENERFTQSDIRESHNGWRAPSATITGYFTGIDPAVAAYRGFAGRVVNDQFVYRKTLSTDSNKPVIETMEYPYSLKPEYANAKTYSDLQEAGINNDVIKTAFGEFQPNSPLKKGWERSCPDAVEFDTSAPPQWVMNPGGIPQNVISRLPRLIRIPAITNTSDIESGEKKYILGECLSLLFADLICDNPVASAIEENLKQLEQQMDSSDPNSLISRLQVEVNTIIGDVFPECGISITPSLQDLLGVLKPKYDIGVFSNVKTNVDRQGTGLIRTCMFAMLRHHTQLKLARELHTRPVVVAFEEPELYLHPAAANMLRDTIYALGESDQIICTTHSPWMIDLSRNPQSLTRLEISLEETTVAHNYGVSNILGALPSEHKQRVKMLQVFDDELSRVFFAKEVIVVEGDSELLAIRETLKLLPVDLQKRIQANFQVVRARGKASIISLVKYLKDLNLSISVMHDCDVDPGATRMNELIANALEDSSRLVVLRDCLEHAMGYQPLTSDKPFKAFIQAQSWGGWNDVPEQWRNALAILFQFQTEEVCSTEMQ